MLEKSVKSRLEADVEVGSFLSGGIDSSIITALAQKMSGSRRIKAFSAHFEDYINELPYAVEIAEKYGVEHYSKNIRASIKEMFLEISKKLDEPFADSSFIPTKLISEFARRKVPVALSGDGGDELFYGYGNYRGQWRLSPTRRVYGRLRDYFSSYHPYHLIKGFLPKERKCLWKDNSFIETSFSPYLDFSEAETRMQKINLADYQMNLAGDILTKVD